MQSRIAGALLYLLVMFVIGFNIRNQRHDHAEQIPSSEAMTAASIRRLGTCLNDSDGVLRERYERYKADYNKTTLSGTYRFYGFAMDSQNMSRYGRAVTSISPCEDSIVVDAHDLDASFQLSRTAAEYLATLKQLKLTADAIDTLYAGSAQVEPGKARQLIDALLADDAQVDPVKARQLDAELTPVAEKLFRLSDALRHDLDVLEMRLRARQLDLIAAQNGQNQDWHTLNVMLRARETVTRLTQAAADQQLTPALLKQQRDALQKALNQIADLYPAASAERSDRRLDLGEHCFKCEGLPEGAGPLTDGLAAHR